MNSQFTIHQLPAMLNRRRNIGLSQERAAPNRCLVVSTRDMQEQCILTWRQLRALCCQCLQAKHVVTQVIDAAVLATPIQLANKLLNTPYQIVCHREGMPKTGQAAPGLHTSGIRHNTKCLLLSSPIPTNADVVSQPVKTWRPGRARQTASPCFSDSKLMSITRVLCFTPVRKNRQSNMLGSFYATASYKWIMSCTTERTWQRSDSEASSTFSCRERPCDALSPRRSHARKLKGGVGT